MNRNFCNEPAAEVAGPSPPSDGWKFAQALHGNGLSRVFHAEGNATAEREQLEWLAKISPEYESQLRGLLREEADARAQREQLAWLAEISPARESQRRGLSRPNTDAVSEDLREWLDKISVPDGVIQVREGNWDPAKHPRGGFPENRGRWSPTGGSGDAQNPPAGPEEIPAYPTPASASRPRLFTVSAKSTKQGTPRSDSAAPARSGDAVSVSYHATGGAPDILNPASKNSVSASFWEAVRRGDWRAAENIIEDVARFLDETKLRSLRTALKRIRGLDAWRKQMSKLPQKKIREQIKSAEKRLLAHLKKRGGGDTAETARFRYELDYLERLLK